MKSFIKKLELVIMIIRGENNSLDLNSGEAKGMNIEGNRKVVQQWIELHDDFGF